MFSNVNQIRILPNSKSIFPTTEDFVYFLSDTMNKRGGYYLFPHLMMHCPDNTLVFFQYDGLLLACATLVKKEKGPYRDEEGIAYGGKYWFDMNTMTIFSNPITIKQIQDIDGKIRRFSQAKQIIDLTYLPEIIKLIEKAI